MEIMQQGTSHLDGRWRPHILPYSSHGMTIPTLHDHLRHQMVHQQSEQRQEQPADHHHQQQQLHQTEHQQQLQQLQQRQDQQLQQHRHLVKQEQRHQLTPQSQDHPAHRGGPSIAHHSKQLTSLAPLHTSPSASPSTLTPTPSPGEPSPALQNTGPPEGDVYCAGFCDWCWGYSDGLLVQQGQVLTRKLATCSRQDTGQPLKPSTGNTVQISNMWISEYKLEFTVEVVRDMYLCNARILLWILIEVQHILKTSVVPALGQKTGYNNMGCTSGLISVKAWLFKRYRLRLLVFLINASSRRQHYWKYGFRSSHI